MDLKKIITAVETDFLSILIDCLKNKKMTPIAAKQSCKDFLAMLPFRDPPDLENKIKAFGISHVLYSPLSKKLQAYAEEEKTRLILERMRTHLKENRIDEALQLVDKK